MLSIALIIFLFMARKKRSLHGTYSPQNEEFKAPIIEMTDILKVPDERFKERLIWIEKAKTRLERKSINSLITPLIVVQWRWSHPKIQFCISSLNSYCLYWKDTKLWSYSVLILRSQRLIWIGFILYQRKSQKLISFQSYKTN